MDIATLIAVLQLSATTLPGIADAVEKVIAAYNEADPDALAAMLAQANADAAAQHTAAQGI